MKTFIQCPKTQRFTHAEAPQPGSLLEEYLALDSEDGAGVQLRELGGDWQVWMVEDKLSYLEPGSREYASAASFHQCIELLAHFPARFWGDAEAEQLARDFYAQAKDFLVGYPIRGRRWLEINDDEGFIP